MQRGFSLIETVVAAALLSGALASLAQFVGAGVQSGAAARSRSTSALLAAQKLEQLRAHPWASISAMAADLTDYLDSRGVEVCSVGPAPCGDAVYARRVTITPAPLSTGVVLIEVDVRLAGNGHGGTKLVTARGRMAP